MAISERDRHLLQQTLDELMDPHVADTLMQHLPPGGWANMATQHDLDELEGRLTNRFDRVHGRGNCLRRRSSGLTVISVGVTAAAVSAAVAGRWLGASAPHTANPRDIEVP